MAERGLAAPCGPRSTAAADSTRSGPRCCKKLKRLRLPPPLVGFGLVMIGPTLLQYGSDEQKREHLPDRAWADSLGAGLLRAQRW